MEKVKIGVVVAIELDAVLKKYGEPNEVLQRHGFQVHTYRGEKYDMYVVNSGAGEICAAMSTQMLICEFSVDYIVNFGVVGGLTKETASSELCVVERVIHYDFDTTGWLNLPCGQYPDFPSAYLETDKNLLLKALKVAPSLKEVTCASADKFIESSEQKQTLHQRFGADICDMECAAVVLTCHKNGVPCLSVKAVADSLTGGGKEFFAALSVASEKCFDIVDGVISSIFG